ncbi:hypothetical protein [Streptomyces luteogriseus]|uniref:hypothetical protein n=1 Tax=Streptomyces luteogriseus TaxID=68233 RepID=UPI00379FE85A
MTDQHEPEDTCRPIEIDGETIRVHGQGELTPEGEQALTALVRAAKAKLVAEAPEPVGVLQKRLRLAHQARRAKEHQLDDIRRALCDIGFMEDDDPYSHADLADVIRRNWAALEVGETDGADVVDLAPSAPVPADEETVPRALFEENTRRHRNCIARVNELLAVQEQIRVRAKQWNAAMRPGESNPAADQVLSILDERGPAATEQEKTTRVFAALHRSAEQDVSRVIALYERWVKAGPPPLGTSTSRWWDKRLVELHNAILPPADKTTEK